MDAVDDKHEQISNSFLTLVIANTGGIALVLG